MRRLPIAGGSILIGDEVIEINTSINESFRHFWEHNRIGVVALTVGFAFIVVTAIRGSLLSRVLLLLMLLSLVAYFGIAIGVNKIFRPEVTLDTTIPRDAIELVVYNKGGKIRRPEFAFIYVIDEEQKGRNVFLLPRWMGEDAPLERILPVFEEEGMDTKPVEEVGTS